MRKNHVIGQLFIIAFAILLLILFLFPLILAFNNSFKTLLEIIDSVFSLPNEWRFDNYINAFNSMNFPRAFLNTFVISLSSLVVVCLFSSMTAHFFLRNDWKFNKVMFALLVAAMIIPFQAIMIPLISIYGGLGLLNSQWTLVYFYLAFGSPMAIFIYHGFLKSIPLELEEAATIDGCNVFQCFFLIVFPLLKPVTATVAILNVLWFWNDYLLPFLILNRPDQRTLSLATFSFYGTYSANYGLLLAALIMTIIPILIVYIFLQKFIQRGIVQGAIK